MEGTSIRLPRAHQAPGRAPAASVGHPRLLWAAVQGLATLRQINTSSQLGAICKPTERALNALIQDINKD